MTSPVQGGDPGLHHAGPAHGGRPVRRGAGAERRRAGGGGQQQTGGALRLHTLLRGREVSVLNCYVGCLYSLEYLTAGYTDFE